MEEKIISKAFECTTSDWHKVDNSWYAEEERYSETVYAETRSKARYKFFLSQDFNYRGSKEKGEILTSIKVRRRKGMDLVLNEPHELASQITKEMFDKAFHAIGKQALLKPYRNRYVCDHDNDWEKMIALGLAEKLPFEQGVCNHYYYLTELGIKVIVSMNPIPRGAKEYFKKDKEQHATTTV